MFQTQLETTRYQQQSSNLLKNAFNKDSRQLYKSSSCRSPTSVSRRRSDSRAELEDLVRSSSLSSKKTSSTTTSVESDMDEEAGDGYGFYEECDVENSSTEMMSVDEQSRSYGIDSSQRSSSSSRLSKSTSRSSSHTSLPRDASVFCLIEDSKAPLVCRSFDSVSVSIAFGGLRIVQSSYSEVAEFKVKLNVDGREYITWRRYSDFQTLGQACAEFSKKHQARHNVLGNTVAAWEEVEKHRPWWVSPTSIQHLLQESTLIEAFMKNLLYEIPCVQMLLEFVLH